MSKPNILFIMTVQHRFDTIAALGNSHIHTPNLVRLVRRGISFTRAYSTCPVCVAARYTFRLAQMTPGAYLRTALNTACSKCLSYVSASRSLYSSITTKLLQSEKEYA